MPTDACRGALLLPVVLACLAARGDRPAAVEIERLVADLGHPDYAVREIAGDRLASLGEDAADALLTAAEVSDDLEVALRAGWLADPGSPVRESDPPDATRLLEALPEADGAERIRIMYRLLRLPDDAGIAPLARLVRLEPTAAGSRIAAALLAGEWRPDDPYWPGMVPEILAGLAESNRPASRYLRGLAACTTATGEAAATAGLAACRDALTILDRGVEADSPFGTAGEADVPGAVESGRIFRRCLVELLARTGRRGEALELARELIKPGRPSPADDPDEQAAAELHWLVDHGLPDAVGLVADRLNREDTSPLLLYAAALARRVEPAAAAALAARARQRLADAEAEHRDRLRVIAGITLGQWGAFDWAGEVYGDVLADPGSGPERQLQAAILYSELLHEQAEDAEAAAVLDAILEPAEGQVGRAAILFNRDPDSLRSRMLYFSACAEPDPAASRRLLEAAVRASSRDVDALIATYNLPDNTPAEQAESAARIARALAQIEEEIQAVPGDPTGKNEYAWLVANTEGNLEKATGYSRASLELSPDSGSYLDTLAHCHAAAGNLDQAIRTQWLAVKQEPHSPLIRRNYQRFLALAAGDSAE